MSVADPGFPQGGGANSPGGRQHTILPYFPKNCMKLKEFWPRGGGTHPSRPPLDPPLRVDPLHFFANLSSRAQHVLCQDMKMTLRLNFL